MNTTFTIKLDNTRTEVWEIDLGSDVLADMSDEEIRNDATAHKVVKMQAKIRGNKKVDNTAESIESHLKKDFPNVTVGVYVAKPSASKLTAEQMLADILSGKRVLTPEEKAQLALLVG